MGIALCEKYNLSKGKSLRKFFEDATNQQAAKLLSDLLYYFESRFPDEAKTKSDSVVKSHEMVERLKKAKGNLPNLGRLKVAFDSSYIHAQIDQMNESVELHPTDAIGKAKELIESFCKTILSTEKISVEKGCKFPKLVKDTLKQLHLMPDDIPEDAKASDNIKQLLGALSSITGNMVEVRNHYGIGHGKNIDFKGLSPRHARLAVGAANTMVCFLWDTYQEQVEKKSVVADKKG